MHVDVVDVAAGPVDHHVVAGRRVVLLELHRPPRAATIGVPHLANTSWPWWEWPARPGPEVGPGAAVVVACRGSGTCGRRGRRRRARSRRPGRCAPEPPPRWPRSAGRSSGPAWRPAVPMRPSQETLCTSPLGRRRRSPGLDRSPSLARTSSTVSADGERAGQPVGERDRAPRARRRPWCGSCRSRCPERRCRAAPGTGLSTGFGAGGGGGRIATGAVGREAAPCAVDHGDRAGHGADRHARVEPRVAAAGGPSRPGRRPCRSCR